MEEHSSDYAARKLLQSEIDGKDLTFLNGIKAGISIAIGYIPIAVTFGLLSKSYNIPNIITMLMSFWVFAGASQFIGIQLIYFGSSPWEIVLTTFILNFRHFLMASSLSQKIAAGASKKVLSLLSFGITDETFAMASLRSEERLKPSFIIGLNTIAFLSWNIGTWIGVFAASGLPQSLRTSMGIALYVMFIALLIPALRGSKPVLVVASTSIVFHSLLRWLPALSFLSAGWTIIIATVISALIGAVLFPSEVS